jgi:hypothetical protein
MATSSVHRELLCENIGRLINSWDVLNIESLFSHHVVSNEGIPDVDVLSPGMILRITDKGNRGLVISVQSRRD